MKSALKTMTMSSQNTSVVMGHIVPSMLPRRSYKRLKPLCLKQLSISSSPLPTMLILELY